VFTVRSLTAALGPDRLSTEVPQTPALEAGGAMSVGASSW
jgi:hypothetical protein